MSRWMMPWRWAIQRKLLNAISTMIHRQQVGDIAEMLECRTIDVLHDDVAVLVERVGIVDRLMWGWIGCPPARLRSGTPCGSAATSLYRPRPRRFYLDGDIAVGERITPQVARLMPRAARGLPVPTGWSDSSMRGTARLGAGTFILTNGKFANDVVPALTLGSPRDPALCHS